MLHVTRKDKYTLWAQETMQFTDLNDYLRQEQFGAVELGCNYVTRSCHLSEWFDRSE